MEKSVRTLTSSLVAIVLSKYHAKHTRALLHRVPVEGYLDR